MRSIAGIPTWCYYDANVLLEFLDDATVDINARKHFKFIFGWQTGLKMWLATKGDVLPKLDLFVLRKKF